MSKKLNSSDIIEDTTLHELLLMMDARLKHIEDMEADNRDIIIKLVKQSNQIVKFLSNIELEVDDVVNELDNFPSLNNNKSISGEKFKSMKELVNEFMDRQKELMELEKELKKHKNDITPDQVGEA